MPNLPARLLGSYLDSYAGLPRKIWLLALVMLVNRSGAMVVAFLSVYLVNSQGFSLTKSGYVMAFFGAGGIVGNVVGGYLNDRFGSWHIMLYSMIGAGFLHMLMGQVTGFWPLCLVAFFVSVVADAFRPANRAAIAIYAPPERLSQAYGLQRIAVNLGFSIGPALGGFIIYAYSYELLFWGDGLTFLLAAAVFYFALPKDETARPLVDRATRNQAMLDAPMDERSRPAHLQPWLILMVLANIAIIVCFFQFFSTLPLYWLQEGYSERTIGLLITFSGITIVLAEMPLVSYAEKRFRPISIMVLGSLMMVGSYLLMPPGVGFFLYLAAFMIVLTVGEILYMPFTSTYVSRWAPPERRGEYQGFLSASYSAAFVVTPILCMRVAETYSYSASVYVASGLGLVGTLLLAGVDKLRERRTGTKPSVRPQVS